MADSESVLLQRFVRGGDPGAFSEIVRRHAGLVYATCLRILADADQAADATQETFFQLVKKADEVTGSIPGWLHRVAVGKAVDLIRRDARRRRREQAYADDKAGHDATWREVCPQVDNALNQLDDQTREILVRHFLEGHSMTALAEELGVSRPTVSRRIDTGLKKLRVQLHRRGIAVATAGLSTFLVDNAVGGAPPSLLQQLGKVSLVGAKAVVASGPGAGASASGIVAGGVLAAAKTKLVVATAAALVIGVGLLTYRGLSSRLPQTPVPPPLVTRGDRTERPRSSARSEPVSSPAGEDEVVSDTASQAAADEPLFPRQSAEPDESAVELADTSGWSESAEGSGFQLDLSSPEATVRSFIKAFVLGEAESVLACWSPTAGDYEDIRQALEAGPDDERYEGRMWFQSLDPDAEMPIVRTREIEGGMELAWRVTLKKDASMGGRTYLAGDTEEIEVTVRPSGDSWLIDNM